MTARPLRVLVVDDSVVHRQTISELLKGAEGIEIVGKAANGEEALRMAALVAPDLITLDLEMPRMDGFTFLRILMTRQPTPVIVISSLSQRENVFKALELGALDFVARPVGGPAELATMRDELLSRVQVVRMLRPVTGLGPIRPTTGSFGAMSSVQAAQLVTGRTPSDKPLGPPTPPSTVTAATPTSATVLANRTPGTTGRLLPRKLVVIGASTGGPQAILDLVGRIPASTQAGFVVAQHMPERFTRTFADRLGRRAAIRVAEAEDGSLVEAGTLWILPGGRSSDIEVDAAGLPRVRVVPVDPADRHVPSVERLFRSAASAWGSRVLAVVMTGMGDDGAIALQSLRDVGAEIWVESADTAIVDGMPAAARKTGTANQVLALSTLISRLAQQ